MSDIPFDVDRAARLSWNGGSFTGNAAARGTGDLDRALASAGGDFRVPIDRLMEHGRLRAEAMTIRDTKPKRVELPKTIGRGLMNC